MKWTKDCPTKEGLYWFHYRHKSGRVSHETVTAYRKHPLVDELTFKFLGNNSVWTFKELVANGKEIKSVVEFIGPITPPEE